MLTATSTAIVYDQMESTAASVAEGLPQRAVQERPAAGATSCHAHLPGAAECTRTANCPAESEGKGEDWWW